MASVAKNTEKRRRKLTRKATNTIAGVPAAVLKEINERLDKYIDHWKATLLNEFGDKPYGVKAHKKKRAAKKLARSRDDTTD